MEKILGRSQRGKKKSHTCRETSQNYTGLIVRNRTRKQMLEYNISSIEKDKKFLTYYSMSSEIFHQK